MITALRAIATLCGSSVVRCNAIIASLKPRAFQGSSLFRVDRNSFELGGQLENKGSLAVLNASIGVNPGPTNPECSQLVAGG